jgi:hypothetical protein
MVKALSLRKYEIDTVLRIIKELTVFEPPKDVTEVKLPGFPDDLTIKCDKSGRETSIRNGIFSNRDFMVDESTQKVYVVPDGRKEALNVLLTAGNKEKQLHP